MERENPQWGVLEKLVDGDCMEPREKRQVKKQYFIAGLGANERAFEKLGDFGTEKIMVLWLKNEDNESLNSYAQRIIETYKITKDDILVGLSFGGLIAQEIAVLLGMKYVILISSFRTKDDLRSIHSLGLKFKLFKLMPELNFPFISESVANFFNAGYKSSKPILKDMVMNMDMKLTKWSMEKIHEQNEVIGDQLVKYNIIGTKDRIMQTWENDQTFKIENGGHFMVYEHAEEISKIISKIVAEN